MAVTNEAVLALLEVEDGVDFLTVDQLARKLGRKKSWVYRQCRLHKKTGFPVSKAGKYCLFDYQKVRRWMVQGSD